MGEFDNWCGGGEDCLRRASDEERDEESNADSLRIDEVLKLSVGARIRERAIRGACRRSCGGKVALCLSGKTERKVLHLYHTVLANSRLGGF